MADQKYHFSAKPVRVQIQTDQHDDLFDYQ
jgi:hypothetical protein